MRLGPNRGRRGAIAAMIALTTLASTMFATSAFAQSASSGPQTTFTWGDTSEPSSLNPMKGNLATDYNIWAVTYNLPIEFAVKDMSPDYAHSIVTSVDHSSDGLTFTYHVRPGMEWSDGQPFTAEDIAWTLNYYKKNNVSNYSADLAAFKDATATDPTTVVITSSSPTSVYAGETVFMYEYILPEHIWSKYNDDFKAAVQDQNVPAVGSGPYVITDYKQGQSVTLERNPNYWGNAVGLTPHYDKLIYVIYNNEDSEAAALQNGEIDFAYIDSANILNTLKGKPNIETRAAFIPNFEEIGINTGSAYQTDTTGGFKPHGDGAHALTDVAVRQAIRMAVDNQTIVDKVLLGYGTAAISPVQPTSTTGNWEPPADQTWTFDIAGANAKLDAAGYKMGPDGVRIDPFNNKPLEFRYYTRNSDQNTIETAPFVKDWLAQIGIKIDVLSVASNKLTNIILAGEYDLFDWGWYVNPDPNSILNVLVCNQRPPDADTYRNSDSYYCNPEYDKLYKEQLSVTDPAKRPDIVHQMQALLYRDQPYIMMYFQSLLEAWRTDQVTGFLPQPSDSGDVFGEALFGFGPFSVINIRPASATSGGAATKGASSTVWIVLIVVLLAVVGGVAIVRRRRVDDEDRA
jgi:peptide/nickel transport system substrate-binding protein